MSQPGSGSGAGASDLVDALVMMSRAMVALSVHSLAQVDADVTLQQYRTLVWMVPGPLRVRDLAQLLGVHSSTTTRMCDRLLRKGLIQRQEGLHDRREAWISLTLAGADLVARGMDHRQREIEGILAGIESDLSAVPLIRSFAMAAGQLDQQEWWRRVRQLADGHSRTETVDS